MKASVITKRCSTLAGLFAAAALFATPALALAQIQFTEVMYDTPGADAAREWLEVTNVGNVSVDLTGYKLFEGGVNHGLTAVQGSSVLAAGESAVIAANSAKFLADYPAYTGTILKSSFSLTNTGEALELRDKALTPIASVSYSSALGASGDGNSLHLSGATWVPGAPNPGSSAPTTKIVKAAPAVAAGAAKPTKTSTKTSASKKSSSTSGAASGSSNQNTFNSAAVSMAPLLQNIPSLYLYILGLVAIIAIGIGAVLFLKPSNPSLANETKGASEEFELE